MSDPIHNQTERELANARRNRIERLVQRVYAHERENENSKLYADIIASLIRAAQNVNESSAGNLTLSLDAILAHVDEALDTAERTETMALTPDEVDTVKALRASFVGVVASKRGRFDRSQIGPMDEQG